jgi:hypothetical protein
MNSDALLLPSSTTTISGVDAPPKKHELVVCDMQYDLIQSICPHESSHAGACLWMPPFKRAKL